MRSPFWRECKRVGAYVGIIAVKQEMKLGYYSLFHLRKIEGVVGKITVAAVFERALARDGLPILIYRDDTHGKLSL